MSYLIIAVLVIGTVSFVAELVLGAYRSSGLAPGRSVAELDRAEAGGVVAGEVPLEEVPKELAALAWLALEGQGQEITRAIRRGEE